MVFGPFHCCAFCERAAPDAPETIDDRGAAPDVVIGQSMAARAGARPYRAGELLGPITPTVYTNDSTLTETKAFVSVLWMGKSKSLGWMCHLASEYGDCRLPPVPHQHKGRPIKRLTEFWIFH